jgi:hypothetical protein
VQNAALKEKPYKLSDGNGLHLLVNTNGGKLWRLRYRSAGKQNMLSLGSFPKISFASARTKRDGRVWTALGAGASLIFRSCFDRVRGQRLFRIAAGEATSLKFARS